MSSGPLLAFLDANVLFSRTLRDWICWLSLDSEKTAFEVRWSEDVLAEWVYQMRRKRPDIPDQSLGRLRRSLEAAFPEAMVDGYRPQDVPRTPDVHDWHVFAAAVSVPVHYLVTADKRGFDRELAERMDLHILSPDSFLLLVAAKDPELVQRRIANQIAYLRERTPGLSAEQARREAIDALHRAGAVAFARHVAETTP